MRRYALRRLAALVFMLLVPVLAFADHSTLRNDTFSILPDSNQASFRTNSQTIWDHEQSQREGRFLTPFVFSGGTHGTAAGLISSAFATEGFVPERVNQTSTAITYTTSTTNICWTILSSDNDGITSWIRVGTTAYYFQCQGEGATVAVRPTLPANSTWLLEIFITGGALTTVVDISNRVPVSILNTTGVYSIKVFGARCDGTTDDSGAFRLAHLVLSSGATLTIPESDGTGVRGCVLASTVTFTKRINLVGFSANSIIFLTMGTGSDGLVYNAGGTTIIYGLTLRNFAILGGATAARNCLVMRYISVAMVNNVHVACGTAATGYAVWLQDFVLQSHLHFIVSLLSDPAGSVPANGVKATTTPGDTSGTFNANKFDLDLTGPGTAGSVGLYVFSAGGGGGNNEITGTYQGWAQDGIRVRGGSGAHVHNVHLEGGAVGRVNRLYFQDHSNGHIGPSIFSANTNSGDIDCLVQTSTSTVIDGISCNILRLENATSSLVLRAQTNNLANSHIEDASLYTAWAGQAVSTGDLRVETGALTDGSSIAVNGSFENWTTTTSLPPNIGAQLGGAPTWARSSTIVQHGNFSANVTTTAAALSGAQLLNATQTARLAGRRVGLSAWIYVPAGQPDVTPFIYFNDGAATAGLTLVATKDAWVEVTAAINILANGTIGAGGYTRASLFFVPTSGTTTYYIDAVSVVPALVGTAVYYAQNPEEYARYHASVTVNPGLIAANTTVGTSVTVNGVGAGDTCMLGPPAAIDAGLGWSCVVTAADTVNVRIHNVSAGGITPASASWAVIVTRRP